MLSLNMKFHVKIGSTWKFHVKACTRQSSHECLTWKFHVKPIIVISLDKRLTWKFHVKTVSGGPMGVGWAALRFMNNARFSYTYVKKRVERFLEIHRFFVFCSTSLTGRPFSIFVILGVLKRRSNISSFCQGNLLKTAFVQVAFLRSRGAQKDVKKMFLFTSKFHSFRNALFFK